MSSWGQAWAGFITWGFRTQAPTSPAYGPPFITLMSPFDTNIDGQSQLADTLALHSTLTDALAVRSQLSNTLTFTSDIDERE